MTLWLKETQLSDNYLHLRSWSQHPLNPYLKLKSYKNILLLCLFSLKFFNILSQTAWLHNVHAQTSGRLGLAKNSASCSSMSAYCRKRTLFVSLFTLYVFLQREFTPVCHVNNLVFYLYLYQYISGKMQLREENLFNRLVLVAVRSYRFMKRITIKQ